MKKQFSLILAFLLLSYTIFSQNKKDVSIPPPPPPPAEKIIPPTIPSNMELGMSNTTVKKTPEHKLVVNTKLYIVPPKDFEPAKGLSGYSKGESALIYVMDVPQNVEKTISDIMDENNAFAKKGVKFDQKGRFTINGKKAVRLRGANGLQHIQLLAVGDKDRAMMIIATCQSSDKMTQIDITAALNTAFYDETVKNDPLAAAKFSLDIEDNGLKFENTMMGTIFMFSPSDTAKQKGMFMVMQIPDEGVSLEDFAEQMIAKMAAKGIEYNKVASKKDISIDGVSALEQIVESRKSTFEPLMITYIVTLKKDGSIYAIMGMGAESGEKNENWYRKTAMSFRFKK
jgi:hypothetical protein